MTDFRIRGALAPFLIAAAALAPASASAAPIVSFAQGVPSAAHPCAQESSPGLNNQQGICVVPAAVSQARANWVAGLTGAAQEEFEAAPSRQLATPALFSATATLTLGTGGGSAGFYNDPLIGSTFVGRFNTTGNGGAAGWWFEFGNDTATILFANPVEAFGFYLTDLGDDGGSASVSLFNGQAAIAGGSNLAVVGRDALGAPLPLSRDNGSVLFFGVTADGTPFDRVTLTVNPNSLGGLDFVGLDSLIIGNVNNDGRPLPAPGTLALSCLALLFLRRLNTPR